MTAPARRRIGQLIRLLSSDQLGEAGAAAQALTRALASAGVDIHQLADVAEAGLPIPIGAAASRPPSTAARVKARRPDGAPLQMGEGLICDQPSGLFRECRCGGLLFTVAPGVGPHAAQLVCDACGSGGRWLGRRYFEASP